ncbi:hypothetical protein MKX01_012292 [Papaver californicum]|nr:hypothetical protein MKX01_012292 [Papaver californicum]
MQTVTGHGMITLEELRQALEQLGLEADQSELESTVLCYVKPGNTGLEYEDFEALHQSLGHTFFGSEDDLSDPAAQEDADLAEAFKVFDEDGDGYISATELQVVLDKLGLPEAQEMDRVQQFIIGIIIEIPQFLGVIIYFCPGFLELIEMPHSVNFSVNFERASSHVQKMTKIPLYISTYNIFFKIYFLNFYNFFLYIYCNERSNENNNRDRDTEIYVVH